jgi:SAM-dependent methyltransferase
MNLLQRKLHDGKSRAMRDGIKRWLGDPHFGRVHRYDALLRLLKRLKLSPRRILDAGCGNCGFFPYLKRLYPAARIVGIDVAVPSTVPEGMTFLQHDLQQPPPNNLTDIDLIVSIEMLQYPENDLDVLRNLRRVARPGATIVVCVMAKEGRSYDPKYGFRRFRRGWKTAPRILDGAVRGGFTQEDLTEKLELAGWHPILKSHLWGTIPMLAHTLFEAYRNLRFVPYFLTPLLRVVCWPFALSANAKGSAILTVGHATGA